MASDYGLNFGFRRSDESVRVSEGRYRSPKTGTLLQGIAVVVDPATPGYLKVATAAAPIKGLSGLLVQELAWDQSIRDRDASRLVTADLGKVKNDRLSVMTFGSGTKVWLRNTPSQTRADGYTQPAVTMIDLTGVAVGDMIGWNGTTFAKVTDPTLAWGHCITVDTARARVELVLSV